MIIPPRLQLDWLIITTPLCLIGLGILLQYSAAHPLDLSNSLWELPPVRHGLLALVGITLGLIVARLDYGWLSTFAPTLYLGALGLLGFVLVLGYTANNVQRWIQLGIFPVQPSELAKLAVAVALARYFAQLDGRPIKLYHTLISLLLVGIPLTMVYLQPDLGTATVFFAVWFGSALTGGVPFRHFLMLGLGSVLTVPLMVQYVLKPYMQERLSTFLNPGTDPLGAGYNVLQSQISVGSGGLLGKGLFHGTQNQLDFLRVQQTDFIFSVLGEELGFVGTVLVFALFMIIMSRGLQIALQSRDSFGRILASGIVMILLVHVFVNVGVNIQILPVTGIPLPFLSFGGSSLLTALIGLGILQSIHIHRQRPDW